MLMQEKFQNIMRGFEGILFFTKSQQWSDVTVDFTANRHQRPRLLREGERAVYAFFQDETWLRIGQTSYSQRFTSQHYGTRRAKSSFAIDIWRNKEEFGYRGREEDIGEWIFANFGRANIILPAQWPATVAPLLEAYLHYRLNPRFEGPRKSYS